MSSLSALRPSMEASRPEIQEEDTCVWETSSVDLINVSGGIVNQYVTMDRTLDVGGGTQLILNLSFIPLTLHLVSQPGTPGASPGWPAAATARRNVGR